MIVTLDQDELNILTNLAHARNDPKERRGYSGGWRADRWSVECHILGLKAEYSVAKLLGLSLDSSISLHGDNHNGDIVLPNDKVVEVKYRNRKGWDFALTTDDKREFKSDIGVLCYPGDSPEKIEVHGWISRDNFFLYCEKRNYSYGPRLVVRADYFKNMSLLIIAVNALVAKQKLISMEKIKGGEKTLHPQ